MIDDHPAVLEGYQLLLEKSTLNYDLNFEKAFNSDQAWYILNSNLQSPFQIVFLDICMSPSLNYKFVNGEELGLAIRKKFGSKIIVLTSLNSTERLLNILQNIQPEGLLIKTDITGDTLSKSVSAVLSGESYMSERLSKIQSNFLYLQNNFLDIYDLKIIHLLSKGEKMKNLPNHLPLSLSTIERRKNKIKLHFGVETNSDYELLAQAKSKGFI